LTEGPLKADVCTALTGMLTIGTPGAAIWRPALDALRPYVTDGVRLAFDIDRTCNATVAAAQRACAKAVTDMGLKIEVETWH
jgi:hypothetical protein